MKALVKTESAVGLKLQDIDLPTLGSDDILIKVQKTAICGTCLLYTSPSPRDLSTSRMPSSA